MIRELFGKYAIITEHPCQVILAHDSPDFPAGETVTLIRSPWNHGQGLRRILFQTVQLGLEYCRDAVLLTTDSKTPFFLPTSCKLVPLVTDLAVFRLPETYKTSRVLLWQTQYRYILRRADLFLTISEFTKQEMTKILGIPSEKIRVVPMACSEQMKCITDTTCLARMKKKYHIGDDYILFVGNMNPRKNLKRIICAFDLLKERTNLPQQLVIAGEQGWKFDRGKVLEDVKHREDILFTGFVQDEDMPALYSAAALFAFPTIYEGFGIPVIEAQSCGTPVVTSNSSALPEVVGDSAVLVDPLDPEDICRGMRLVLENRELAEQLMQKGAENVKRFSWGTSAQLLDEIIEDEVFHHGHTGHIPTLGDNSQG